MSNLRIVTIVIAVLACAFIVAGAASITNDDSGISIGDAKPFNVTCTEYKDSAHPSTVVKYEYHGEDVTGKTFLMDALDTTLTVTTTSSERLYGVDVYNVEPSNDGGQEWIGGDIDKKPKYTIVTKVQMFSYYGEPCAIGVSPCYSLDLTDWPSAMTYTTLSIQDGLTCTIDGKEVKDGDVIETKGSNTFTVVLTAQKKTTLIVNGEWSDESTFFGGWQGVTEKTFDVQVSAIFEDHTGTLTMTYKG